MHNIYQSILYFGSDKDQQVSALELYTSLLDELRIPALGWLRFPGPSSEVEWPNWLWDNGESASCNAEEWAGTESNGNRHFRLEMALAQERLVVVLGVYQGEVLLFVSRKSESPQPASAPDDLRQLLSFTYNYCCTNREGLLANRHYLVGENAKDALIRYIEDPDRILPVVAISPLDGGHLLSHPEVLAVRLQGIAAVFQLDCGILPKDLAGRDSAWQHTGCYGGAVTVFFPFSFRMPPYCRAKWRFSRSTQDAIQRSIFWKAIEVSQRSDEPEEVTSLERQRSALVALRAAQAKSQGFSTRLARKEVELGELAAEYAMLQSENHSLVGKIEALEQEKRELQSRCNYWRSRFRQVELDGLAATCGETGSGCIVHLSRQVRKKLDALHRDERQYWDNHIFCKIQEPRLRSGQSEATELGTFLIFPRGKALDGRRLAYYLESDHARVCEIFTGHDEYERFRNQNLSRDNYDDFEPWAPGR